MEDYLNLTIELFQTLDIDPETAKKYAGDFLLQVVSDSFRQYFSEAELQVLSANLKSQNYPEITKQIESKNAEELRKILAERFQTSVQKMLEGLANQGDDAQKEFIQQRLERLKTKLEIQIQLGGK